MNAVKQPTRLFNNRRKVLLREDLMELTKDINQALVLSQMIYWTKRVNDLNDLIFEENKRLAEHGQKQKDYCHGWIWKSARQMKEELFHALSEDAIQRAFANLTEMGLFVKRRNPEFRYDRTLQYRVDLLLLRRLLKEIGIDFTDFQLDSIPHSAESITHTAGSIPLIAETIPEITLENTSKSNPLTPLTRGTETSAMASDSKDELNFSFQTESTADANASFATAQQNDPPTNVKPRTRRVAKNSPPTEYPAELNCPAFKTAWEEFLQHRKEKKAPVTPTAQKNMFRKFVSWGTSTAIDAIDTSISNGWTGVFEPNGKKKTGLNDF